MEKQYTIFQMMENLFIYLEFCIAFNTVQIISRWVVGRAEETSTNSWSRFCTVNCRPTASNYQLFPLEVGLGTAPQSQRWEVRVLPLCHHGSSYDGESPIHIVYFTNERADHYLKG